MTVAFYCAIACFVGGVCIGSSIKGLDTNDPDDVHIFMLWLGISCVVIAGVIFGLKVGGAA